MMGESERECMKERERVTERGEREKATKNNYYRYNTQVFL